MAPGLTPIIMNATVRNASLLNATFIQSPTEGTDWTAISNTALAIATIFLAGFTLLLWLTTRKYAKAAESQVISMKTQVSVMNIQTQIMEKQKEIVQKQADSAEKQAIAMDGQVKVMENQRDLMDEQKKIAMDQIKYESSVLGYHRLRDEMDRLVAPLNSMARTGFEYYEPAHLHEKYEVEGETYWRDIRKNAYLASDDLYDAIEKYLKVCEKQKEELRKVRYEIFATDQTPPKILLDPIPINVGVGNHFKKIEELRDEKGIDTDYGKKISWLLEIIQDGNMYDIWHNNNVCKNSVEEARSDLKDETEKRYETLSKQLKDIEKDLCIPISPCQQK